MCTSHQTTWSSNIQVDHGATGVWRSWGLTQSHMTARSDGAQSTILSLQYRFIPNSLDSSPLLGIQYILHLPSIHWSILSKIGPPRIDHLGILCTIRSDQVISVAAPRIVESHGSRGGRRTGFGETGQSRQSQPARPTNPEGIDGASWPSI